MILTAPAIPVFEAPAAVTTATPPAIVISLALFSANTSSLAAVNRDTPLTYARTVSLRTVTETAPANPKADGVTFGTARSASRPIRMGFRMGFS